MNGTQERAESSAKPKGIVELQGELEIAPLQEGRWDKGTHFGEEAYAGVVLLDALFLVAIVFHRHFCCFKRILQPRAVRPEIGCACEESVRGGDFELDTGSGITDY